MTPAERAVIDQLAAAIRDRLDAAGIDRADRAVVAIIAAITDALIAPYSVPPQFRRGVVVAGLGAAGAILSCR